MQGNLRFKIDSGSPLVGTKFTIFALLYFVFEGNFQIQAPTPPPSHPRGGGLYLQEREGTEVFLRYEFGGPIYMGSLFSEFYAMLLLSHRQYSFLWPL